MTLIAVQPKSASLLCSNVSTTRYSSSHNPFHGAGFSSHSKREFSTINLALKNFSSQVMRNDCRSSGCWHESERKIVSLEDQLAPLRNCAYSGRHQILGPQAVPAEGLVLEKQQFRNCLEKLQVFSLSLTACGLNTFRFLRHCVLSASPGSVIIVIFSSQKTEGEMLILYLRTSSH